MTESNTYFHKNTEWYDFHKGNLVKTINETNRYYNK